MGVGSETVVIGDVFHNIFHSAFENIAELVDGIDLHIFVVAQPVKLRVVDIVAGIQIVLGNAPLLHGFPQPVILYQIHRHLLS